MTPGAFKLRVKHCFQSTCTQPHHDEHEDVGALLVEGHALGVAVPVAFEKESFETGKSHSSQVQASRVETRRFQAIRQLLKPGYHITGSRVETRRLARYVSTCTAPHLGLPHVAHGAGVLLRGFPRAVAVQLASCIRKKGKL